MKKIACLILTSLLLCTLSVNSAVFVNAESVIVDNGIKSVYELDTGIIGYPSVITFVDSAKDLEKLDTAKTPAMAILRVKKGAELIVTDAEGQNLAPLIVVLNNTLKDKIIPAFYVSDTETAAAVGEFIDEYELFDDFVVSSDAEILRQIIFYEDLIGETNRRNVAGMLEIADTETLTFSDMSALAAAAGARCALVDINDFSYGKMKSAKSDYEGNVMTVYYKLGGAYDVYRAIAGGAEGICICDFSSAIEIIESFTENTLIHPITLQAHRGMDVVYNENTLEGIIAAAYTGTNTVEIDPRLTKDLLIVLSHDADVARVTDNVANGKVKDYTLEQLKSMEIIANADAPISHFCALEDVFKEFKRLGIKAKLALDAKETDVRYVDILFDLIEKYDIWDCIASIGIADSSQRNIYVEKFGAKIRFDTVSAVTVGHADTLEGLITNWMSVVYGKISTAGGVDPYYDQVLGVEEYADYAFPEVQRMCKDRGLKLFPYQFDTVPYIEDAFMRDFGNLSTGYSGYLADFLDAYSVKDVTVRKGDAVVFAGEKTLLNGTKSAANAEGFIVVDGDKDMLTTTGNGYTAAKNGTVKVMPYVSFTKGNLSYRVYSDIVTVTVGETPVEPDNPDKAPENSGGCSSAFNIAESFGIISVACAFGAIVCVLRRKRND